MERIFLLCIKAPEHVTTKLTLARNKIFNETGIVSALALDPVIPVSFYSEPPAKEDFNNTGLPDNSFKTEIVEIHKNSVFLGINNRQYLKEINDLSKYEKISQTIFTPFPGFYISEKGKEEHRDRIVDIIHKSGLTGAEWSRISLEVLEISFGSTRLWFNSIDWSIIWEQTVTAKP